MYEVEFKVELSEAERDALEATLLARGFVAATTLALEDVYVEAADSPLGGYDLKRYRDEGSRVVYAEKIWEEVGSQMARREDEREATRDEMAAAVAACPSPVRIRKERRPLSGTWEGRALHVDMDTVQFDHSPGPRYFAEAEIVTPDAALAAPLKESVKRFLREALGREDLAEAWGMFTMALKKL